MKYLKYTLFSITFSLSFLFAVSQKTTGYVINGEFSGGLNNDTVHLYDENNKIINSTAVKNNKFVLKGKISLPQRVMIGNQKLGFANPIILENDTYSYKANPELVFIKGGKLHTKILGHYSHPEYLKLHAGSKKVYAEHFTNIDMNDEVAVKRARRAYDSAYNKMSVYENKILNAIIEDKKSTTLEKLFALTSSYDYKTYPVEERGKMINEYEKKVGNNPSLIFYKKFLKMSADFMAASMNVAVGKPFMEFVASDKNGKEYKLSDVVAKNKFTILEFWASWCGPCRGEIPNLKNAYEKYKDKGLEIYSVSLDAKEDAWLKALDSDKPPYMNLHVKGEFENESVKKYGILGIPASFLIDANGIIVAKDDELREFNLDRTISKFINQLSVVVDPKNIPGNWSGEINYQGVKIPMVLKIKEADGVLSGTMDSPSQGAKDIPVENLKFANNTLSFDIKMIAVTFSGKFSSPETIDGNFVQSGISLPLALKKMAEGAEVIKRPQMPKPPFNYNIEEVTIKNAAQDVTMAGILTTPNDKKTFPVVVMITGSGDQNRDEEVFGHKPFWVIADYFTKNGIGVLRMDDRGVGGTSRGNKSPTSADFATDIDAAVNYLAQRGYANIGLVGHSEGGGIIAPIVAAQNKIVKFLVSMAGPGVPIEQLMATQVADIARASGEKEEIIQKNLVHSKNIYQLVKTLSGKQLEEAVKEEWRKYFAQMPESQLPPKDQREQVINMQARMSSGAWSVYYTKFIPDDFWSKIKIPVLALNGTKDLQVSSKENLPGIKKSLTKAGNKNFEIVELPGLNHLFQVANTGLEQEYGSIEQTISPEVLDMMVKWILKISAKNK